MGSLQTPTLTSSGRNGSGDDIQTQSYDTVSRWSSPGSIIGTGGQARISSIQRLADGMVAAYKLPIATVYFDDRREERADMRQARLRKELSRIYSRLFKPDICSIVGIISVLDCFVDRPAPGFDAYVFEYCCGSDLDRLETRFTKHDMLIPEQFIWHVFQSVTRALLYLHTGIILDSLVPGHVSSSRLDYLRNDDWFIVLHRDIKPENIFLKRDPHNPTGFPLIKLADFDLACAGPENKSRVGTRAFWPPEWPLMTTASDMWALGATLHCLMYASAPGEESQVDPDAIKESRSKLPSLEFADYNETYSRALDNMMRDCLDFDRHQRASACELAVSMPESSTFKAFRNMPQVGVLPDGRSSTGRSLLGSSIPEMRSHRSAWVDGFLMTTWRRVPQDLRPGVQLSFRTTGKRLWMRARKIVELTL